MSYKIVARHGERRTGWVNWSTEYIPGIWTFPLVGYGPLCLFDTYENALRFSHAHLGWTDEIWLCEYMPSEKVSVWDNDFSFQDVFPEGTILADAVKLKEKIR